MKLRVPHTYVLLFLVIIVVTLTTYVVPAGVFERVQDEATGRTLVEPESFHYVEQTPVGPFDMVQAIPKGMRQTAHIIFFIFIVAGSFAMIQSTGAIDAGVLKAMTGLEGREKIVIPAVMLLFSAGGATFGLSEEVIAFVPIGILVARSMGYDDIVGLAMLNVGANIGFAGGMLNPFTVGTAQTIAELPLFSAIGFRFAGHVLLYIIGVAFVLHYAAKVKADPTKSIVYDLMQKNKDQVETKTANPEFTSRHKWVLLVVLLGFGYMVYGVMREGWFITEISALFLGMGIIAALVGRIHPDKIASSFVEGAKGIAFGALIVGIARAILVVMTQGQIIDTVIASAAGAVAILPGAATASGMFLVQLLINFLIPSGSGQAAATMPIMVPLADLVGLTRQTAVLAYQYGDAFSNMIIPTSASLLGVLGMAKIPYERWVKFIWPLMILYSIAAFVLLTISVFINLGPF